LSVLDVYLFVTSLMKLKFCGCK